MEAQREEGKLMVCRERLGKLSLYSGARICGWHGRSSMVTTVLSFERHGRVAERVLQCLASVTRFLAHEMEVAIAGRRRSASRLTARSASRRLCRPRELAQGCLGVSWS